MRSLKGLAGIISISIVHWFMGEDGWTFEPGPNVILDTANGVLKLHQLYRLADPGCTSRVTVPVLWDKKEGTIVSNESADILRMFNSAFDNLGAKGGDYCPRALRAAIDEVNLCGNLAQGKDSTLRMSCRNSVSSKVLRRTFLTRSVCSIAVRCFLT